MTTTNTVIVPLLLCVLGLSIPGQSAAELKRLDDQALGDVSGQGGIYLSGDVSINELGGFPTGSP